MAVKSPPSIVSSIGTMYINIIMLGKAMKNGRKIEILTLKCQTVGKWNI